MPTPAPHGLRKRTLLRDEVYESIRDAIIDGTFRPGERLKDPELEKWLGVSRTPIREALLRLERAGLVVASPGRATIVAPLDPVSTVSAQQVVASMHELATRLAVPRLSPALFTALTDANARFEAALGHDNVELALACDDAFHEVFILASGNDMIPDVLEHALPLLRRVERHRFSSVAARHSVTAHAQIIRLAALGDADGAALAARNNWLSLDAGASPGR